MPRSRKRGQRGTPATPVQTAPRPGPARASRPSNDEFLRRYQARAEERNAAARATLVPLADGEHPWPLLVAIVLTVAAAIENIVAYATGTTAEGTHLAGAGTILFAIVMLACAVGMWRLWYQAVLAFMVLLAIVVVVFALLLVEASNLLGLVVGVTIVFGGGFLFWKLVRVLGRLQMPTPPQR